MNTKNNEGTSKQQIMRPLKPTQLTQAVMYVGELHFEGNVIPHVWYQHPIFQVPCGKGEAGHTKAYIDAILLLSDVLYWYRPTVVRDEDTGEVTEVRRKFAASMLQKNYETWGRQFGMAKWRVQDAVKFLRERGLLRMELKAVETARGLQANVVFVEPILSTIKASFRLPAYTEEEGETGWADADESAGEDTSSHDNTPPLSAITRIGLGHYRDRSRPLSPHSYITTKTTTNSNTDSPLTPQTGGSLPGRFSHSEQTEMDDDPQGDAKKPSVKGSAPRRARPSRAVPSEGRAPTSLQATWKPEDFKRLLAAYPKGDDKGWAIKAWDALRPNPEFVELLVAAATRFTTHHRSANMAKHFIPTLFGWLDRAAWENDVCKPAAPPPLPVKAVTALSSAASPSSSRLREGLRRFAEKGAQETGTASAQCATLAPPP